MKKNSGPMTARQYQVLADFRYQLRRFMRYSETVTRRLGVTPQQYQLLLQIKALTPGRRVTVGALAERLQAHHHGVVSLITRSEKRGLVARRAGDTDLREVHISLTPKGEEHLERLARLHRNELAALKGQFVVPEFEEDER